MRDLTAPQGMTRQITNGVGYTTALFVRDRFGLPSSRGIPPLSPTVQHATVPVSSASPDEQSWDKWWDRLNESAPATLLRPDHDRALAALWDEVVEEARWWESAHVLLEPYTPEWMWSWTAEHSGLGEGVLHTTEVVGIEQLWSEVISFDRLLVSISTFRDDAEMETVYRSALLGALAGERPAEK
jgi:hypothetical protein